MSIDTKEYRHRLEFILKSVHGISSDVILEECEVCFGLNDFDIFNANEYVEYVEELVKLNGDFTIVRSMYEL